MYRIRYILGATVALVMTVSGLQAAGPRRLPDLASQVSALQTQVTALSNQVAALRATLSTLQNTVASNNNVAAHLVDALDPALLK